MPYFLESRFTLELLWFYVLHPEDRTQELQHNPSNLSVPIHLPSNRWNIPPSVNVEQGDYGVLTWAEKFSSQQLNLLVFGFL
jgi:hypothetical protein